MWRDISDDIEVVNGKIIHDNIEVGIINYGMIGVFIENYRVRLEREYDDDQPITRFFVEHKFTRNFIPTPRHAPRPLVTIHNMKILELGNDFYVIAEKVESFKRVVANKCKIRMDSGIEYEVDFDAGRIKQKLEELTGTPK